MAAATNGIAPARRPAPVCRDLLQLSRLPEARAALRVSDRHPLDLRLHPRFGLPRRGRPDARTDRAACDAAGDAELLRHSAGRLARDARSVEARRRREGRAVRSRTDAAESCRSSANATQP